MASAPPELPQSIVLGQFSGIRNTVSEERLAQTELAAAVNVDIDAAGQLRRRRGYVQRSNANWHSIETLGDMVLGAKDGVLGLVRNDFTHRPIVPVGPDRLCYVRVGDMVYYSSRTASGKITSDGIPATWGEQGAGMWLSPVVQPTDTLGAIGGKMLSAPPNATAMDVYKGRIYLAAGRVLWATELYLYDKVDKGRNYIQTEADITMVRAVGDGLYVGTTTQLLFLQGTLTEGFKQTIVLSTPVIAGSSVLVPWSAVHPRARTQDVPEGEGPVFMTGAGICLGLDGGEVYNLTQGRVAFPGAASAAALYRDDQGANSYVAVADSAGGPVANARIGDYVDAEIIRASQGG